MSVPSDRVPEPTFHEWIARLDAVDRLLRVHAAARLSTLGQSAPEVVAALAQVLRHGSVTARKMAALALGDVGALSAAAVPALAEALADDEGVARRAAITLGRIGLDSPEAVVALRQAQAEGSAAVRAMAALALEDVERARGRAA
jgi:HEAT repeat protein